MSTAVAIDAPTTRPAPPEIRRHHAAAVVRVGFGLIWAIDASFKFLPGFVHGQTLPDELGKGSELHTPVIHQWIQLWFHIATWHPGFSAPVIGVIESCIAIGLITGAFSNLVFIGSAVFSLGIWSAAEAFHLPWTKPGMTDLGPSVGYIFASLALYFAAAGATWSLDNSMLRAKLGRFSWLTSPKIGA